MGNKKTDKDCLFCRIIKGEIPSQFLYRDDDFVVIKDIHPQAPIHFLVIPCQHIPTLNDLDQSCDVWMGKMMRLASKMAQEQNIAEDGFRAVLNCNKMGGQVIFHLHLHILGGKMLEGKLG